MTGMFDTLINAFRQPELKKKILFTLLIVVRYPFLHDPDRFRFAERQAACLHARCRPSHRGRHFTAPCERRSQDSGPVACCTCVI